MRSRGSKLRLIGGLAAVSLLAAGCTGANQPDQAGGTKLASGADTTIAPSETSETTAPGTDTTLAGSPGTTVAGGKAGGTKAGGTTKTTTAPTGSGSPGASTPNTTPVDAPGDPQLFSGAANTHGITPTDIVMCAHAALTYGPAFNATTEDFNVYYSAVNDAGGVFGRKIAATYENDNYDPAQAVTAAETCKAKKPFAILGGIGFDQIPSVRNWAEQNKELYFHHIATAKGSQGKQYSYTTLPTVERVGEAFGDLAVQKFKNKKIGVLYRDSEYWQPGFEAFKAVGEAKGLTIVRSVPVQKNQAEYTQALLQLKNAGAEVVFGWENTLALTQMVKQAKAQSWSPIWLAFPFNLTAQTLGDEAMTPPMIGLSAWPGYSKGDYTGTFASYADDMKEFEAQYRKYRPNTDIGGVAGDLLWMNWIEQKRFVALLRACGKDCTRNHLAGLLVNGYKATTSPTCPIDFSGGKHDGSGGMVDVMETYRAPDGKVNWRSTARCKTTF